MMRDALLFLLTIGLFVSCSAEKEVDNSTSQIFPDITYSEETNKYTSVSSGENIDGHHKKHFDDGDVQADLTFRDGDIVEGFIWDDDRNTSTDFIRENNEGFVVSTIYSDEGVKNIRVIRTADRKQITEVYKWYEDGTPESEMTPDAIKMWYPNGVKKEMAEFNDGALDGRVAKWHENGQIAGESFHVNDLLHGDYLEWDEEGSLITEKKYEMGELVE